VASLHRDSDANLKLRVGRYFWDLGYASHMEVAMSASEVAYGELKRFDLTDLDVLGTKFENDLSWRTIIGDCKSGKASAVTRLFWLRGIMEFFGADRGYLAIPKIGPECREVAARLDVSLLDEENLQRYEHDKQLEKLGLESFSMAIYEKRRALWGLSLAKGQKPADDNLVLHKLYQFFSYRYWFHEEYLNVLQSITAFQDSAEVMERHPDRLKMKMLAYTGLALFSVALLKMCGSVIATKSSEIHNEVRRYIFGGAANAVERGRLMKLLGQVADRIGPVADQRVRLEPPYYGELLELANRVISYSRFAKNIPHYCYLVLGENVLARRLEGLASICGGSFEVDTLKLTKDVAQFLSAASGLDKSLFEELMSQ
jgi:hypothetical protein